VPSTGREGSSTSAAVAEQVRSILASKRLTLYRASQQSVTLYGLSSPYFLPHHLYYDLRAGSFRPSIHQIFALSRISAYRVADWLRVFGFDLEDITRLQILLPSKRTMVLDTSLTQPNEWIPWIHNRPLGEPIPSVTPLARLLELGPRKRIASVSRLDRHFIYAKVGVEDAFAFPDLAPGSIVRVNPDTTVDLVTSQSSGISDRLFLLEHSKGFSCCRIRILGGGVIVPFDNGLSYGQVEFRCPQEARLWGAVELDFRPLLGGGEPKVPKDLARQWKPQTLPALEDFGQLLKRTRTQRNLSIREAAAMSRIVAEILKDDRYATSPSSLSDYELRNLPPRDFHKIITLCSIYGMQFESVMKRMGIDVAEAGTESMPDRYLARAVPTVAAKRGDVANVGAGFIEKLLGEFLQIPLFLRNSLGHFTGSAHVSLDDFFWVGGDDDPLHPFLADGLLAMVNRRRKTPFHFASKRWWQQPLYIVLMREGVYVACCCSVENGLLVIHPYSRDFHRSARYRLHQDAEVVGQIVAVMRRFS
jgi:transcriptional regulator with XRE-family HTH domain